MHGCCFTGFRVPTLYKDQVLLHSCLACSTLLLSLLCRQVEGSGLSVVCCLLRASVDLLQSHNFLSSFAASLDSIGMILTGLAPAIYMQRIVEMVSNKNLMCIGKGLLFSRPASITAAWQPF